MPRPTTSRVRSSLVVAAATALVASGVGVPAGAATPPAPRPPAASASTTAGSAGPPAVDTVAAAVAATRRELRRFPAEWTIVRGVYSTLWSFGGERWETLLRLVRDTEVNALVIDVKDDAGMVAWRDFRVPLARKVGADGHTGLSRARAAARIRELRRAGGYPIARVVVFKDPIAAPALPSLAIRSRGGGVWRDRKGTAWLDANRREAWDYAVDVGREAARLGFLEVQFDYVRFPTDGDTDGAVYGGGGSVDHRSIRDFLAYAREQLHAEGVRVSADIFGLTTYKAVGQGQGDGTGQRFEDIIREVDYVSPMVYPSHYYPGNYGLADPEANPYEVVVNAMREAQTRVQGYRARVRPWLEDFSLSVPHHPGRVAAQLRATYENGIESWLLWNAGNRYSVEALGAREVSRSTPFVAPRETPRPGPTATPTA